MAYGNNNYQGRGGYSNNRSGGNGGYNRQQGVQGGGNDSGYRRDQGQSGGDGEKQFGARFRIRGLVCKAKNSDDGFTMYGNNGNVCGVSVLVKNFVNTGNKDQDGKIIWDEVKTYYRLVAFGRNVDAVAGTVLSHAIMDFSGTIKPSEYNGAPTFDFVIDKVEMIKPPTERQNNAGGGYGGQGGYQQREQRSQRQGGGEVNYDERPNNSYNGGQRGGNGGYQQREQQPQQRQNIPDGGDYVDGPEGDIPF